MNFVSLGQNVFSSSLTVPPKALKLCFGVNDPNMSDNSGTYVVDCGQGPIYLPANVLPETFSACCPSVTPGQLIHVTVSGTGNYGLGPNTSYNAKGDCADPSGSCNWSSGPAPSDWPCPGENKTSVIGTFFIQH